MPLKDDWLTGDSFAAADENAVASQVNDNTDWIAAVTATTAELNTLDGITSTVTELNYTDGVTSSIQTQLDTKYGAGGTDVPVTDGGTGRSTGTTAYSLVATGTTATGAQQTLANGATTEVLVGGGAAALPAWTTATGSGAPVRATGPALTTPNIGTPSAGTLTNCTGLPVSGIAASTATAVGVGTVELGHASDTTLSRSSAGVLAVEGNTVPVNTTSATHTAGTIELGHASDTTISRVSAGVVAVEGVNVVMTGGALGTPASGTLTNCTGLPVSGITASTATAVGVGSIELGHASDTTISRTGAGAIAVEGVNVLLNGGALGTPASGTLTNCTGLPVSGVAASTSTALGVGSVELGHASDTTITRTGAGAIAVEGTAVLLSGGALGTPASGTLTNATGLPVAGITASTSTALGVGTLELGHATDTTLSRSAAGVLAVEGVVVPSISSTNTLTNKWVQPRVVSPGVAGTYTIDWTTCDQYVIGTQNAAITNLTATGSAVDGYKLMIRIKGDATPRAITWDSAKYVSSGVATLLATTAASKTHYVGLIYDGVLGKMVCVAVDATGY